jgi:hypothetical protein
LDNLASFLFPNLPLTGLLIGVTDCKRLVFEKENQHLQIGYWLQKYQIIQIFPSKRLPLKLPHTSVLKFQEWGQVSSYVISCLLGCIWEICSFSQCAALSWTHFP